MKILILGLILSLYLLVCSVAAQTKLKVAYPTTVGSMAVLWMTKRGKVIREKTDWKAS